MNLSDLYTAFKNSKVFTWLANHSPLGNQVGVQIAVFTVIILLLLGFCSHANAAELDIMGGSTVVRGPTGVIAMNLVFPKQIANYGNIELGLDIIGKSNFHCPNLSECNNNQAVVHAEVVAPIKYLGELGIGLAHIQHEDAYNSGSINFSLSLEHKVYKSVYFRYQHFSNAGTTAHNEGRDMVLFGWRF